MCVKSTFILVATVMVTVVGFASSARNCGDVSWIANSGEYGPYKYYYVDVHFSATKNSTESWMLSMKMTQPFEIVHTSSRAQIAHKNYKRNMIVVINLAPEESMISKGEPVSTSVYISWKREEAMPKVEEIMWMGEQICEGARAIAQASGNAIRKLKSSGQFRTG